MKKKAWMAAAIGSAAIIGAITFPFASAGNGDIGVETGGYQWVRTPSASSHDGACRQRYSNAHVCVEWCEFYIGDASLFAPTGKMCCSTSTNPQHCTSTLHS